MSSRELFNCGDTFRPWLHTALLFAFTFFWWAPAHSSDWTIVHRAGDIEPWEIVPGTYYQMDNSISGVSLVTFPADPSEVLGCVRLQKRDPTAGKVLIQADAHALGAWWAIALSLQDDWAEICSDGLAYYQIGGMGGDYGLDGGHRTFVPTESPPTTANHWYQIDAVADRGKVIRWTAHATPYNGGVFLPAIDDIGAADGLYRRTFFTCIQFHNPGPSQAIWIQAPDGLSINDQSSIMLTRDLETVCLDTAGDEWTVISWQ